MRRLGQVLAWCGQPVDPTRLADMFSHMGDALVTTVVGSYPQPDWLIDRERLGSRLPPRVRARELWRIAEPHLEEAQDDATRIAVSDMERAGVDIVTDGEMRRLDLGNSDRRVSLPHQHRQQQE